MGSSADAGGVDRSLQSTRLLFEEGNYAELRFGYVSPSVSGVGTAVSPTPGGSSGSMTSGFEQLQFGYKRSLGDGLDVALILDQPFGAQVDYGAAQPYFAAGSQAKLDTTALTGLVKYRFPSNLSVFGGLRYQTFSASAAVPFISDYAVRGEQDDGIGYVVGAAYERPDIALRIALTYNSTVSHSLRTTETSAGLGGPNISDTRIKTPQSINLDLQSGIAEDTLLFGSIRWVEWSNFDITPTNYFTLTGGGSLVGYNDDRITYTLGIGRRLSDDWSAQASITHEASAGGFASNLGPTDGFTAATIGARYTGGPVEVGFGVSYVVIGEATTTLGGGVGAAEFTGNTAVVAGLSLGYRF